MASLPSLDKLLEGVPPEKLDAPCKDVHLCEIALSITNWEVIAPFLGISRAEAEEINRDEGKTVPQRIGMLRKWKEKCGRRATYRRLAKRFLKVKRVDLVNEICKILGDGDSSSDDDSPPPDRKVIVRQTLLDQYADHLQRMYPKEIPSFTQWPPSPTHKFFNLVMIQKSCVQLGPIDEEYIRLTQRGNVDDIMLNKTAIQVKDIFHLYYGSSKRAIVLVEGAPGAGKSTLAWYICDQWGSGKLFGEFKLVVFVQLRSSAIQTATSIADLLPRMASGQEREILSHLETRCGRDVLFVLDGWDEYSGGLSRDSICRKLICSPGSLSMQESTVLITSRPVASGELQQHCTNRIEIVGFAPKEVEEYFKDALRVAHQGEQQTEVLQECLKVRPVIQASCYLPLNAAIVVHLFITEGNTLPTTLHGLFTSLVLNCIVRHLKKTRQEEGKRAPKITSFQTIPSELLPHFSAICALAFHGIMTNRASFSEEELHSFHLSTESSAPLLSLIQGWSTFKSSWEDFSYSFFHLSVQELLAAFHISKQPNEQQVEVFRKLFGQPRFAAVLNFYAAFTKFHVEGIRDFIKELLQHSSCSTAAGVEVRHQTSKSEVQLPRKELHKTILDCLFEAQDPALCQYIAAVMEGKLTVDYTMSPFHCMVLGYFLHCLCLTPGGGKLHIDLASTDLDEYKCSYLINELKKYSHGQLSLSLFEDEQDGRVALLVRMLEESCIHCISDLSLTLQINESTLKESLLTHDNRIPVVWLTITALGSSIDSRPEHLLIQAPRRRVDSRHVKPVADFITGNGHGTLKELTLSGCVLCEGIAQVLVSCLGSHSVLDTLVVSDCTITPDGANILGNSLELQASTAHIKSFYLSEGKPPDNAGTLSVESAHQIDSGDAPFETSYLRVLHLSRCTEVATVLAGFLARNSYLKVVISESMPPENAGLLAVALAVRSKLESWDLSGHTISSAGMKKLSEYYIGKTASLNVLNLSQCNVGLKSMRVLVDSLCRNQSLKTLNLSRCTMPSEGATHLARLLTRNSSLEALISGCSPPESAGVLAVALAVRSAQESWNLSGHTIPPEGMKMLAVFLANNPDLKVLNLSGCFITLKGTMALVHSLARNSSLEVLISECSPPESAGILAVALAVRSNQESWDLSGHTLPSEGIKMLADALTDNQALGILNLSQCSLSTNSMRVLTDSLSTNSNPNLKILNLPGSSITPDNALALVHCLERNSNLKILISECSPPECSGMLAVIRAVRSNQETWDLSGHTIPSEYMKLLANSLAQNPSVKVLNLSRCSIPPQSLIMIAGSLSKNPYLKTLNISQCIITPEDTTVLAGAIAADSNLEVLIAGCRPPERAGILAVALAVRSPQEMWDLSGHTISPEGMKMLVDSLADNTTLKALNLSGCYISPECALSLAHSLARNSDLEVLTSGCRPPKSAGVLALALAVRSTQEMWDLSGHTISPGDMKMLVLESLADNTTLKALNLSGCYIAPEGALALAHSLARNSNLEVLISRCRPPESAGLLAVALAVRSTQELWDLSGHTIPPEGMRLLANSRNPHVKTLNLSHCNITPEDAIVPAGAIAADSSLEVSSLDLSVHTVPPESMKNLADFLDGNTTLNLSGCFIPPGVALELAHSLTRNSNSKVLISGCRPPESAGILALALAVRSTDKLWDVSGHTISLEGVIMLAGSLDDHPTLKALNLTGCCIPLEGALKLARSLATTPNFEVLISKCSPPKCAEILAVALAVRSSQESWDLSGHSISLEGMKMLADFLADNPTLEALNLSNCSISPDGALTLARSLARNSNLEVLILGCTPPESAGILAVALTVRSAQETWDLSGHTIPPGGMKMLAKSLATDPSVKTLNLSCCTIPPEGVGELCDVLAEHTSLDTVHFSGCSPPVSIAVIDLALAVRSGNNTCNLTGRTISAEIVTALGYLLDSKLTIDTLNLSRCTISQKEIRLLAQDLSRSGLVKELNFSRCELQDDMSHMESLRHGRLPTEVSAADHLMVSLTDVYKRLKVLDLSSSRLGSQGAKALESFLQFNWFLEVLILSYNDLSAAMRPYDVLNPWAYKIAAHDYPLQRSMLPYFGQYRSANRTGAHYLAQGLRWNHFLRSLNIAHCNLTYPLMKVIVKALERHLSLKKLDFSGNLLTQCEYQALNDHLKKNRRLPKV